jgi:hypothetical protein
MGDVGPNPPLDSSACRVVLMTALAARVERIDIVGEPQRKLSNSLRQFASMPVELIAAQ